MESPKFENGISVEIDGDVIVFTTSDGRNGEITEQYGSLEFSGGPDEALESDEMDMPEPPLRPRIETMLELGAHRKAKDVYGWRGQASKDRK